MNSKNFFIVIFIFILINNIFSAKEKLYKVIDIKISSKNTLPYDKIIDIIDIEKGRLYSLQKIGLAKNKLINSGYFTDVDFSITKEDDDKVVIELNLVENQILKSINIYEFNNLNNSYKYYMKLKENMPFNPILLEKDLNRLYKINYVSDVSSEQIVNDNNEIETIIKIEKESIVSFKLGLYKPLDVSVFFENILLTIPLSIGFYAGYYPEGIFNNPLILSPSIAYSIGGFVDFYYLADFKLTNFNISAINHNLGFTLFNDIVRNTSFINMNLIQNYNALRLKFFDIFKFNLFSRLTYKFDNSKNINVFSYNPYGSATVISTEKYIIHPFKEIIYSDYGVRGITNTYSITNNLSINLNSDLYIKILDIAPFYGGLILSYDFIVSELFDSRIGAGIYLDFDIKNLIRIPINIIFFTNPVDFFRTVSVNFNILTIHQ